MLQNQEMRIEQNNSLELHSLNANLVYQNKKRQIQGPGNYNSQNFCGGFQANQKGGRGGHTGKTGGRDNKPIC